jgi:hypothetical protein
MLVPHTGLARAPKWTVEACKDGKMTRNGRGSPRPSGRMHNSSAPRERATPAVQPTPSRGTPVARDAAGTDQPTAPRHVTFSVLLPHSVHYQSQNASTYEVLDIRDQQFVRVPKQRGQVDIFPPDRTQRTAALRLLRWSGMAMVIAVLGGVPAIVVGLVTALVALSLMQRLGENERVWRHEQRERGGDSGPIGLPASFSAEAARLRTAFWQGLLAAALGAVVLVALLNWLP